MDPTLPIHTGRSPVPGADPEPAPRGEGQQSRLSRLSRSRWPLVAGLAAASLAVAGCTLPPGPPPGPPPGTTQPGPSTTDPGPPTPTTVPVTGSLAPYEVGSPALADVWLDPARGDDASSGTDRDHALRTMQAAWARVPADSAGSSTGTRIRIARGTVPIHSLPNNWYEGKHGSADRPIVIEAADGAGSVTIEGGMNIYDTRYVYLLGLRMVAGGSSPAVTDVVLHGELVDHLLVRDSTVVGDRGASANIKEGVKMNQSTHVYLEHDDISGGWDNPVDFVAVQYGHAMSNVVHHGGDWCMYVKGGSAYYAVDSNEMHDCGTGGFTAGQGTGFEYMTSPWLHYEAYGIEATNNVIHDVEGAGLGVNGGYNILYAYNTLYRVGSRSHTIEVVHGSRGCDGESARCAEHNASGGWGPASTGDEQVIPARHVSIVNNVVYNPAGYRSQWQQFEIHGPSGAPDGWNIPSPSRVDDDLVIAGNVMWNGPADLPLGIEGSDACQDSNPTCNEAQLRHDNAINTIEPRLANPAGGDFRLSAPIPGRAVAVPAVSWGDAPARPDVRALPFTRTDAVTRDRTGTPRSLPGSPGAC